MKVAKSLEKSDLLVKCVSEIIKNETKEQKSRFVTMLLGTSVVSLLENLLTGKGVKAKIPGRGVIKAD